MTTRNAPLILRRQIVRVSFLSMMAFILIFSGILGANLLNPEKIWNPIYANSFPERYRYAYGWPFVAVVLTPYYSPFEASQGRRAYFNLTNVQWMGLIGNVAIGLLIPSLVLIGCEWALRRQSRPVLSASVRAASLPPIHPHLPSSQNPPAHPPDP